MSQGKVVQIIGAVVDVEFPRDQVPKVYDALKVEGTATPITLEVQQQLGDGVVRCIALGASPRFVRLSPLIESALIDWVFVRRWRQRNSCQRAVAPSAELAVVRPVLPVD